MIVNDSLVAKNLSQRKGATVKGIVLHDTAGSGTKGDAEYLAHDPENRKVSVDFVILKTGEIYQLNPDLKNKYTNHAGRSTRWKSKGLVGATVNKNTVGIEISQKAKIELVPDPKYTDLQVQSVAQVCVSLCEEFGLTKMDITTHKDLITDGSRSDPRQFPWDQFWEMFNQLSQPQAVPTHITHVVQKGDTLYSLAVKYNTKIEVIKALNGMDTMSNVIQEGETLIVKE